MSITPRRADINSRVLPDDVITTQSNIDLSQQGYIGINVSRLDEPNAPFASWWYQVGKAVPHRTTLGVMEGLVAARFATEALVNVVHLVRNPIPEGYGELLSKYGMAEVRLVGETYKPWDVAEKMPITQMNSGGADSAHILFERLNGQADDCITFYHGQATYRTGVYPEEQASRNVIQLARDVFHREIRHHQVESRWRCRVERKWAKAYRNFMLATHAYTLAPGNIIVGTSIDDRLHDSFPEFIAEFSRITPINIIAPNIRTDRRQIMFDLAKWSSRHSCEYLLANTTSCQLVRYLGKKYFFCGSCHSCLLRLPGAEFGIDPRFSNFKPTNIKLFPKHLESQFQPEHYYKRKPSVNALTDFFVDFKADGQEFQCFIPVLSMIDKEWGYKLKSFLSPEQLSVYTSNRP